MSARSITVGPSPLASSPTTPAPPPPAGAGGGRPDDAGAADARRHVIAGGLQALGRLRRRAVLLQRQLGVRVDVAVEALEAGRDPVEPGEDGMAAGRLGHAACLPGPGSAMLSGMDVPHGF